MGHWWEEYAAKTGGRTLTYGERILHNRSSAGRTAKMTGLSKEYGRQLARWLRTGALPTLPHPDSREAPSPATVAPPVEREADGSDLLLSADYIHNERDDTYVTFVPGVAKPIVLGGETHRAMVRAYSNFDGQPATLNELARTFGMPRNWLVGYLRVHGITHDREPFTPEELATRSDDELVGDAMQMRRMAVHKKLERAKWTETLKDAQRWREVEAHVLTPLLAALKGRKPVKVRRLALPDASEPFAAVVGISDFHHGKYSDAGENWTAFNRDIARARLFAATVDLLARLNAYGRPEVIYVPIGSDFLHIDNDKGETTSGTPQDSDGTPAEMLVTGAALLEEWIATLTQVAPVELVLMSGNHDRMMGLALLMVLEATFRQHPDVTARMDRTPRTYRAYGRNLIGFVHGDGVKKTRDIAGHMAQEAAEHWAHCTHKTAYTGHLHNERTETDTIFNVTRRQLPSLAGTDRWHARNGFIGAPASLPLYLHSKERGLVGVLYSPVAA